jgi:hypothetical protein
LLDINKQQLGVLEATEANIALLAANAQAFNSSANLPEAKLKQMNALAENARNHQTGLGKPLSPEQEAKMALLAQNATNFTQPSLALQHARAIEDPEARAMALEQLKAMQDLAASNRAMANVKPLVASF